MFRVTSVTLENGWHDESTVVWPVEGAIWHHITADISTTVFDWPVNHNWTHLGSLSLCNVLIFQSYKKNSVVLLWAQTWRWSLLPVVYCKWTQLLVSTQCMCVCVVPPAAQECENGYCKSQNALREWRACGEKLSYEDFAKFHEVRTCMWLHRSPVVFAFVPPPVPMIMLIILPVIIPFSFFS